MLTRSSLFNFTVTRWGSLLMNSIGLISPPPIAISTRGNAANGYTLCVNEVK